MQQKKIIDDDNSEWIEVIPPDNTSEVLNELNNKLQIENIRTLKEIDAARQPIDKSKQLIQSK